MHKLRASYEVTKTKMQLYSNKMLMEDPLLWWWVVPMHIALGLGLKNVT